MTKNPKGYPAPRTLAMISSSHGYSPKGGIDIATVMIITGVMGVSNPMSIRASG